MHEIEAFSLHPELIGISLPDAPVAADLAAQARLSELLAGLNPDWHLMAPFIKFDAAQYSRHRFFTSAQWEALVICWLPGQGTVAHDHGQSWGISSPIFGTLTETNYRIHGEEAPLEPLVTSHMVPGAVSIETADTVHVVVNASPLPAVSIHLYSPPLRRHNAYDIFTGASWPVAPQVSR
ncbi:MAG TPA: cysteine dioxygenase family protein [Candidatus Eremiobacteraceae bacterium]